MQHRAFDSLRCFLVSTIVLDVDCCRSAIFLTDSMNASRIEIGRDVFFENLRAERTLSEGITKDSLGSTEQIALGQRLLLRQQDPGPISLCETRIRAVPRFENRNHVKYGESLHVLRMIQSHPVGDASSAIVTDQRERRETEFIHDVNQFRSHGTL